MESYLHNHIVHIVVSRAVSQHWPLSRNLISSMHGLPGSLWSHPPLSPHSTRLPLSLWHRRLKIPAKNPIHVPTGGHDGDFLSATEWEMAAGHPQKTRWDDVEVILGHRLRRWPRIKSASDHPSIVCCVIVAGNLECPSRATHQTRDVDPMLV